MILCGLQVGLGNPRIAVIMEGLAGPFPGDGTCSLHAQPQIQAG